MDETAPKPKRATLTKAQAASEAGAELLALCQQIAQDGRLTDIEIGELKQWSARHRDAGIPAIAFLNETVARILEDGIVTDRERREMQRAVERIMPLGDRKEAVDRRKEKELAEHVEQSEVKHYHSKVSGVTFKNADGTERQQIIRSCREGQIVLLEREPNNEYNPLAVQVLTPAGQQIGYLPNNIVGFEGDKDLSWGLARKMDNGLRVEARIAGIRRAEEGQTLGVSLELAFWNGPLDYQPQEPYFPPTSGRPNSNTKHSTGCTGCLGTLAALIFFRSGCLSLVGVAEPSG